MTQNLQAENEQRNSIRLTLNLIVNGKVSQIVVEGDVLSLGVWMESKNTDTTDQSRKPLLTMKEMSTKYVLHATFDGTNLTI